MRLLATKLSFPNCLGCGVQLKRHHNKRCRACFGKFISERLSGDKHYRYKDGRKKPCMTCGKIITSPYPRNCRECWKKSMIGKINPNCKNTGRTRFKQGFTPWNKGDIPYPERKRISEHNRRHAGGILLTYDIVNSVYKENKEKFGSLTCIYCFKKLTKATIEHLTPVSRGGSNDKENLSVACKPCNSSKKNKTYEEYIDYMALKGAQ